MTVILFGATARNCSTFGGAGADLQGYDTCLFCLGVASAGMNEADYTRRAGGGDHYRVA